MASPRNNLRRCAQCGEPVVGPVVTAGDKHYHPSHFVCNFPGCGVSVLNEFYLDKGRPFCRAHVKAQFTCGRCNGVLTGGRFVTALGRAWHPECFACKQCGTVLSPTSGFLIRNHEPYCDACYNNPVAVGPADAAQAPASAAPDMAPAAASTPDPQANQSGSTRAARAAFQALDTSASGKLGLDDLGRFMRDHTGNEISQGVLQRLFQTLDTDSDGAIEFEEFLVFYRKLNKSSVSLSATTPQQRSHRQSSPAPYRRPSIHQPAQPAAATSAEAPATVPDTPTEPGRFARSASVATLAPSSVPPTTPGTDSRSQRLRRVVGLGRAEFLKYAQPGAHGLGLDQFAAFLTAHAGTSAPSKETVQYLFKLADADQDGVVGILEFVEFYRRFDHDAKQEQKHQQQQDVARHQAEMQERARAPVASPIESPISSPSGSVVAQPAMHVPGLAMGAAAGGDKDVAPASAVRTISTEQLREFLDESGRHVSEMALLQFAKILTEEPDGPVAQKFFDQFYDYQLQKLAAIDVASPRAIPRSVSHQEGLAQNAVLSRPASAAILQPPVRGTPPTMANLPRSPSDPKARSPRSVCGESVFSDGDERPFEREAAEEFARFLPKGMDKLSVVELTSFLRHWTLKDISPEGVQHIFRKIDANNDGFIGADEFYKLYMVLVSQNLGAMHRAPSEVDPRESRALSSPPPPAAAQAGDQEAALFAAAPAAHVTAVPPTIDLVETKTQMVRRDTETSIDGRMTPRQVKDHGLTKPRPARPITAETLVRELDRNTQKSKISEDMMLTIRVFRVDEDGNRKYEQPVDDRGESTQSVVVYQDRELYDLEVAMIMDPNAKRRFPFSSHERTTLRVPGGKAIHLKEINREVTSHRMTMVFRWNVRDHDCAELLQADKDPVFARIEMELVYCGSSSSSARPLVVEEPFAIKVQRKSKMRRASQPFRTWGSRSTIRHLPQWARHDAEGVFFFMRRGVSLW